MIEEKWENIEATNLSPLKEKKIPLKPSQPLLRVERPVADYHLHGLSSSLARLYQLVSYIRRGQSATSSVRARGRPPSPSLSPSSPWNISISRHPTCTIGFIRVANTPKSAPAEKNAKAWLNPEERILLLLLLLLGFSFGHALLLVRSLARIRSGREERGWTTAHWDSHRPLHRNRIRDAFVTYRVQVNNAIRPIDFHLNASPLSSSSLFFYLDFPLDQSMISFE